MTSSATRLSVLGGVFCAGLVVVLLHLWFLMVHDQEVWARRSYENRWAFRSVPSQRGALLDRHGRVLARDEPTTKVSCYYLRFRLRHVVGAAVHGAMQWADLQPGREGTAYGYREGALGPLAAARDFFGVPVRSLRRGVLPKEQNTQLMRYATTVLSGCSGLSRRQSFRALRDAAQARLPIGIGDVLEIPRRELMASYRERLDSLYDLDRRLLGEQARRAELLGIPADELPGLLDTLEFLRVASLQELHVEWTDDAGERREGSLLENVRRTFAEDVSFELAAALRVDRHLHPGIEVHAAVRRVQARDSSLRVLLGKVLALDRTLGRKDDDWFERHANAELPESWLDDLVPEGLVASQAARARLQQSAKRRYEREMLARERRGVTGLEAAFDDDLMGRLGMRFVEHDSKRREHLLWSHLRVESGESVRLTIDYDLQVAAEAAVQRAFERIAPAYVDDADRKRLEAALAIIDAKTGDVLAYAGAPIVSENARDVPGVVWLGNGAVGSVLKPIVMVEHLESQRLGRPHASADAIVACSGRFRYGDRFLKCDHQHWDAGRDPVRAIAESCNVFFYQASLGLENDGLARALRRFGLLAPAAATDPFAACWQPSIRGLAAARPRMDADNFRLPQRAIGYGVQASPVHIARAYAGLATGRLPTLGLRYGEGRAVVQLGDIEGSLDIVREGMRECVTTGTGDRLDLLKELDVHGKTGTAEVSKGGNNNAWFAGFVPWASSGGVQLAFCAVVYWVPDRTHGGEAAGQTLVDFLRDVDANPVLQRRYLTPESGR